MADKRIFRQAALDRLSSPEQLDRLMRVTSPRGWIALTGLCVIILAGFVWSVFGRVPTTLVGSGILMSSEGIREVEVVGSGVVTALNVTVGDLIEEGHLVAQIGQPRLEQRVTQADGRLQLLQNERQRRVSFSGANTELETEALDRELEDLGRRSAVEEQRIAYLATRLTAEREALEMGLVTKETVQSTLQVLEAARGDLVSVQLQLQNNELARVLLTNRATESLEDIEERIRQAEGEVQALSLELDQASNVRSPYAGRVQEIRTDVGQLIASGGAIISVEMAGAPLQAVIYFPAEGKRVQPGMLVQISPVTVRREEYGFMFGRVSSVSGQPATPAGMMQTLGNAILVEQLTGRGAPFLVRVTLDRDPSTASGFRWSSPRGPPNTVESGTVSEARVVIEERRPISFVLPIFRAALGSDP